MTDGTTYLSDYEPFPFRLEETALAFDIHEGHTDVRADLRFDGDGAGGELRLDGQELEFLGVAVDGRELSGNEYRLDAESLTVFDAPARCTVTVRTRIEPEKNTILEGLYKSGAMYCTQCEAEGFRRMVYYPDRPDVLSRFTTTITADAATYPVLLSNGNLVAEEVRGGRRTVTWQDPFPKPSYLFALVAGDLAVVEDTFETMSGRRVALRIYSEPHNIGQCGYAMSALKRAMRWDEERFGREYDLDAFLVVAVEDFNAGAMENKGLNIFNTSLLLASPDTATDAAHLRVEAVIGHEYFHNWSGNRVTCRDWFQLSLKEGFTVFRDSLFSADMNSPTMKRVEDVEFLRNTQFPEDAGPLAHPVRPASYQEISNFYTTTVYEKGAEVVGMLRTILGASRFRGGSDLYFARHDGGAVTTEDFVDAMAEVSGLDLTQFRRWYDQAGTPVLSVSEAREADAVTLKVVQECPSTPEREDKQPFHIPLAVGLLDEQGADLLGAAGDGAVGGGVGRVGRVGRVRVASEAFVENPDADGTLVAHLIHRETTLRFEGVPAGAVVSFLRRFSAPVKVVYERSGEELLFLAARDTDGFARWDAAQTLARAGHDGVRRGARRQRPRTLRPTDRSGPCGAGRRRGQGAARRHDGPAARAVRAGSPAGLRHPPLVRCARRHPRPRVGALPGQVARTPRGERDGGRVRSGRSRSGPARPEEPRAGAVRAHGRRRGDASLRAVRTGRQPHRPRGGALGHAGVGADRGRAQAGRVRRLLRDVAARGPARRPVAAAAGRLRTPGRPRARAGRSRSTPPSTSRTPTRSAPCSWRSPPIRAASMPPTARVTRTWRIGSPASTGSTRRWRHASRHR